MSKCLALLFLFGACFSAARAMNQPSAEQQQQANASQQQYCVTATQMLWDTYCDHPPKKVIPVYVDNFKSARNNLAPACKTNPAVMQRIDGCVNDLEARAQ